MAAVCSSACKYASHISTTNGGVHRGSDTSAVCGNAAGVKEKGGIRSQATDLRNAMHADQPLDEPRRVLANVEVRTQPFQETKRVGSHKRHHFRLLAEPQDGGQDHVELARHVLAEHLQCVQQLEGGQPLIRDVGVHYVEEHRHQREQVAAKLVVERYAQLLNKHDTVHLDRTGRVQVLLDEREQRRQVLAHV